MQYTYSVCRKSITKNKDNVLFLNKRTGITYMHSSTTLLYSIICELRRTVVFYSFFYFETAHNQTIPL